MLSLDDPRWGKLQSTYGYGTRVADLISMAAQGAPMAAWYDALFQELCHQYTLSEAAYAATPHLAAIASSSDSARKELLVLIGACYASARLPEAPPIPDVDRDEWQAAARQAIRLIAPELTIPGIAENDLRYLFFALAGLHGYSSFAYFIEGFDTQLECPECGFLFDARISNLSLEDS